jgi:hypothetical protein
MLFARDANAHLSDEDTRWICRARPQLGFNSWEGDLQQLTNSDGPRIAALPCLKDDKVIGVADVDTPEERSRQQSVHFNLGNILFGANEAREGYLMKCQCADLHILGRQDGKHPFHSIWTTVMYRRMNIESASYLFARVVQDREVRAGIE